LQKELRKQGRDKKKRANNQRGTQDLGPMARERAASRQEGKKKRGEEKTRPYKTKPGHDKTANPAFTKSCNLTVSCLGGKKRWKRKGKKNPNNHTRSLHSTKKNVILAKRRK